MEIYPYNSHDDDYFYYHSFRNNALDLFENLNAKLFIFYHQFNFILVFFWVVVFLVAGVCVFSFLESLVSPGMQRILDFGPDGIGIGVSRHTMSHPCDKNHRQRHYSLLVRFQYPAFFAACYASSTKTSDIHNFPGNSPCRN